MGWGWGLIGWVGVGPLFHCVPLVGGRATVCQSGWWAPEEILEQVLLEDELRAARRPRLGAEVEARPPADEVAVRGAVSRLRRVTSRIVRARLRGR